MQQLLKTVGLGHVHAFDLVLPLDNSNLLHMFAVCFLKSLCTPTTPIHFRWSDASQLPTGEAVLGRLQGFCQSAHEALGVASVDAGDARRRQ